MNLLLKLLAGIIIGEGIALSQSKDVVKKVQKAEGWKKAKVMLDEIINLNKDLINTATSTETQKIASELANSVQEQLKTIQQQIQDLGEKASTLGNKKVKQLIVSTEEGLEAVKEYVKESYDSLDTSYDFKEMFKTLSKQLNTLKKDYMK